MKDQSIFTVIFSSPVIITRRSEKPDRLPKTQTRKLSGNLPMQSAITLRKISRLSKAFFNLFDFDITIVIIYIRVLIQISNGKLPVEGLIKRRNLKIYMSMAGFNLTS